MAAKAARRPALFGAQVRGMEHLLAAFDEFAGANYEKLVLEAAVRRAASKAKKAFRAAALRRTGALVKSIKVGKPSRTARTRRGATARVGTVYRGQDSGFYAHFGEYGTSNEAAKPWFRPTWSGLVGPLQRDITEEVLAVLRRMAQKWRKKAESGKLGKRAGKVLTK